VAGFHQPVAILRMIVEILRRGTRRVSLKLSQPAPNVGGVTGLAHLAVAGDIDASFGLLVLTASLTARFMVASNCAASTGSLRSSANKRSTTC